MRGKGVQFRSVRVSELPDPATFVKEKTPGIVLAAVQYGVEKRIIDLCTFDITQNPWRCGGMFDAIVTDPPCE